MKYPNHLGLLIKVHKLDHYLRNSQNLIKCFFFLVSLIILKSMKSSEFLIQMSEFMNLNCLRNA